jgi:hypothetical protein
MAGGYELFPDFDSYWSRVKGWLESRSGEELQDFLYERLDREFDLRDREGMEKAMSNALGDNLMDAGEFV